MFVFRDKSRHCFSVCYAVYVCVLCVYADTDLYTAYMSSSRVGSMQRCEEARKLHCVNQVEHSPASYH